jgi:ryanodine receptor 2
VEEGEEGAEEEDEPPEWVGISSNVSYLAPLIRCCALVHSFIAFAIMVAYYHLKIPLVIFKREKEVSATSISKLTTHAAFSVLRI